MLMLMCYMADTGYKLCHGRWLTTRFDIFVLRDIINQCRDIILIVSGWFVYYTSLPDIFMAQQVIVM